MSPYEMNWIIIVINIDYFSSGEGLISFFRETTLLSLSFSWLHMRLLLLLISGVGSDPGLANQSYRDEQRKTYGPSLVSSHRLHNFWCMSWERDFFPLTCVPRITLPDNFGIHIFYCMGKHSFVNEEKKNKWERFQIFWLKFYLHPTSSYLF